MSSEDTFFRFPHTPHLTWLEEGEPRDDKVLQPSELATFLDAPLVVEEKIDGANVGIAIGTEGDIRIQNRGQYISPSYHGQFTRLVGWLAPRRDVLFDALGENLILFGEWCAARHSIQYTHLPDWFLLFDIYDRETSEFWSSSRRNEVAARLDLCVVPQLFSGKTTLEALLKVLRQVQSAFANGPLEGLMLRQEAEGVLKQRAKIVHPSFTQAIDEHWSRRALVWNQLSANRAPP